MSTAFRIVLFTLALLAWSLPAHAVRELSGQTPGGAHYLIVAPDNWQPGGGLVLYNHGFNLELDTRPDVGPLRDLFLAQGYAIAASGYRQRGWVLFSAIDDNAELVERFTRDVGVPGTIIPFGGSMGGLISLKTAEDPRFAERVPGVLAVCPVASGARSWDQAFDLRLAYDAVCGNVDDAGLPRGAEPHTWALDLEDIPTNLDDFSNAAEVLIPLLGISRCTGLGFNDSLRSPAQRERLARLRDFVHVSDDDTLVTLLAYATFALSDLVRAPDKMGGRNPFQNNARNVFYSDGLIRNGIPRVNDEDPFAALDFHRVSSLYGTGQARIVSLHTSRDEIVVPENQDTLRDVYPEARLAHALVEESSPTHCGFNAAEVVAGWEGLRRWIAGGAKPTPATLQSDCQGLTALGVDGPCRIGPIPATLDMDNKIAARDFNPVNGISGSWVDPHRIGEGWTFEVQTHSPGPRLGSDLGDTAVSWFTFPPPGEPGNQAWIVGAGTVEAAALVVNPAVEGRTGTFPNPGTSATWGRVEFDLGVDGSGWVRYGGRAPYPNEVRRIQQLSLLGVDCSLTCQAQISPPAPAGRWIRSGTYYDPAAPGTGLVLQLQIGSNWSAPARPFIVWYTYDLTGRPLWLVGEGSYVDPQTLRFEVVTTTGPRFGPTFDPNAVQRTPWGTVTLRFPAPRACTASVLEWNSTVGFGAGTIPITRLTGQFPGLLQDGCDP